MCVTRMATAVFTEANPRSIQERRTCYTYASRCTQSQSPRTSGGQHCHKHNADGLSRRVPVGLRSRSPARGEPCYSAVRAVRSHYSPVTTLETENHCTVYSTLTRLTSFSFCSCVSFPSTVSPVTRPPAAHRPSFLDMLIPKWGPAQNRFLAISDNACKSLEWRSRSVMPAVHQALSSWLGGWAGRGACRPRYRGASATARPLRGSRPDSPHAALGKRHRGPNRRRRGVSRG